MQTTSESGVTASVGRLARATTPWGFPVIYLGWAYLFWLPIVFSTDPVWSFPNVALLLVGGTSPLLAGLGLLWATAGRAGYRDLWRRLIGVRRVAPLWWLAIIALYPVFTVSMAGIAMLLDITPTPLSFIERARLFDPGSLALLVAVALVFPAVEEIGLRGYWFDRLQVRWSALVSSLVLGVTWAAWHVPLVYMTGYFDATTFDPRLWWWLPSIVLTAIVGTWVYNNTRRSVLAVIGLHFLGNLTGELMGFSAEMYPFVVAGTAAIAGVLVLVWGPRSLRGWDTPRPTIETSP